MSQYGSPARTVMAAQVHAVDRGHRVTVELDGAEMSVRWHCLHCPERADVVAQPWVPGMVPVE